MTKAKICWKCGRLDCKCKPTKARESFSVRGYGAKWQRFRLKLLRKRISEGTAFCAICGLPLSSDGLPFNADHIEPVTGPDDPRFFDETNIQLVHHGCHSRKTARDTKRGATRRHRPGG